MGGEAESPRPWGAGSGGAGRGNRRASRFQYSTRQPIVDFSPVTCARPRCPCQATARKGGGGAVHCPAHQDRRPSLGVLRGGIPGTCFAGCDRREVLQALQRVGALGSSGQDVASCRPHGDTPANTGVAPVARVAPSPRGATKNFSRSGRGPKNSRLISPLGDTWRHGDTLTLSALAQAKGLDEALLRSLGWAERGGKVSILYLDEAGKVLCVRYRVSLDGPIKTISRRGDRVAFYGLPWLQEARDRGFLVVCEGETDFATLFQVGIPVLAVPGAGTLDACLERSPHVLEALRQVKVYVTREPDSGGEKLVEQASRHLPDALVVEMATEAKDWNGLWLQVGQNKGAFLARVRELLEGARTIEELTRREEQLEAEALLEEAREFLLRPDILSELVRLTRELGHAGDDENVAALHLALATVRLGPASVLIKGSSSSGKSHLLETALKLWPGEVYTFRSGASERWLAYTSEDFRHRFIVLAEARALESEFGAYLARTLVSEGRLVYETVEKTALGLQSRRIEKEGPTALIATTTASMLDEELETRCWTIESREDEGYLAEAAMAIARRHSDPQGEPEGAELARKALRWLYLYGAERVVVPFAGLLAERVPVTRPSHLRLFDRLLRCIEASAWLHQLQRERDGEGRIVASIADYAIARRVMERAFEAGAKELTGRQEEALAALSRLSLEADDGGVPLRQVARELGKSPGTVRKHLQALARKGYVASAGKGGPYKPDGEPPHACRPPTPEELAAAFAEAGGVAMSPGVAQEEDKTANLSGSDGRQEKFPGIPPRNDGDRGDTGDTQIRDGVAMGGNTLFPESGAPQEAEAASSGEAPPHPPRRCPRCQPSGMGAYYVCERGREVVLLRLNLDRERHVLRSRQAVCFNAGVLKATEPDFLLVSFEDGSWGWLDMATARRVGKEGEFGAERQLAVPLSAFAWEAAQPRLEGGGP